MKSQFHCNPTKMFKGHAMRALTCATLLAASFLAACSSIAAEYSGDGTMIDNGPLAATDRYVVNLGPIDLARRGELSFRLSDLPSENFVCGFELTVQSTDHSALRDKAIFAVVSMEVKEQDGKSKFRVVDPLNKWTWSVPSIGGTAFLYQRGTPGSFFSVESGRTYQLTVTVLEPEVSKRSIKVAVLLKSAGWK